MNYNTFCLQIITALLLFSLKFIAAVRKYGVYYCNNFDTELNLAPPYYRPFQQDKPLLNEAFVRRCGRDIYLPFSWRTFQQLMTDLAYQFDKVRSDIHDQVLIWGSVTCHKHCTTRFNWLPQPPSEDHVKGSIGKVFVRVVAELKIFMDVLDQALEKDTHYWTGGVKNIDNSYLLNYAKHLTWLLLHRLADYVKIYKIEDEHPPFLRVEMDEETLKLATDTRSYIILVHLQRYIAYYANFFASVITKPEFRITIPSMSKMRLWEFEQSEYNSTEYRILNACLEKGASSFDELQKYVFEDFSNDFVHLHDIIFQNQDSWLGYLKRIKEDRRFIAPRNGLYDVYNDVAGRVFLSQSKVWNLDLHMMDKNAPSFLNILNSFGIYGDVLLLNNNYGVHMTRRIEAQLIFIHMCLNAFHMAVIDIGKQSRERDENNTWIDEPFYKTHLETSLNILYRLEDWLHVLGYAPIKDLRVHLLFDSYIQEPVFEERYNERDYFILQQAAQYALILSKWFRSPLPTMEGPEIIRRTVSNFMNDNTTVDYYYGCHRDIHVVYTFDMVGMIMRDLTEDLETAAETTKNHMILWWRNKYANKTEKEYNSFAYQTYIRHWVKFYSSEFPLMPEITTDIKKHIVHMSSTLRSFVYLLDEALEGQGEDFVIEPSGHFRHPTNYWFQLEKDLLMFRLEKMETILYELNAKRPDVVWKDYHTPNYWTDATRDLRDGKTLESLRQFWNYCLEVLQWHMNSRDLRDQAWNSRQIVICCA